MRRNRWAARRLSARPCNKHGTGSHRMTVATMDYGAAPASISAITPLRKAPRPDRYYVLAAGCAPE
jgi:hypothetical protein